jgi:DNA-directed RNA polymerase specialized sigma24 family protein
MTQGPNAAREISTTSLAGFDDLFDSLAAGLYNLASMLVGEGEDSVRLVEKAVQTAEVSSSDMPGQANKEARLALCRAALALLERRNPGTLAAPEGLQHAHTCIEDSDLDAIGVSGEEFSQMLSGPDRDRVRTWLGSLPTEQRVIFVMRAVAGFNSPEAASILASYGGDDTAQWTPDAVREIFRQALCSLASQLIHATTSR